MDGQAVKSGDSDSEAEHRLKRTIVTTSREGFAGLLGGDVRLEEALARLNHPARLQGAEAPAGSQPAPHPAHASAVAAPTATPRLRPTIDDGMAHMPSPDRVLAYRPSTSAAPAVAAGATRPVQRPSQPSSAPPVPEDHQRHSARCREEGLWEDEAMSDEQPAALRPAERLAPASASRNPAELMSSEAANAASSAFNRLAEVIVSRSSGGERTLDEITREVLRPLLKSWLDDNLPPLVERLVREEIERVARPGK